MSSNKRPFDWLGLPGSGSSSKRPRSPTPQATSSNTCISNLNLSNPNQSLDPPSTSSSSSANVPQTSTPVREQANSTGHAMLSTLKGSMKLLRGGCRAIPPLQSAVGGILEVFEAIETTKQGSEELRDTLSDMAQWATELSDYLSENQAEEISDLVDRLEVDFAEQAEYVRTQPRPGKLSRFVDSEQEIEELGRCYRRIEATFRQYQMEAALKAWKIAGDHIKESRLNALNPSHNALYNSSFSDKIERRACLENTRASVLDDVKRWIYGPGGAKIHWTNGMAGTGKTTIAYSICTELERSGRLGASFFCSRASSECSDVSRILPTIAYQLAQQFYPFRSSLCRIIDQDPSIGQRNISEQFAHLIETPMIEVGDALPNSHVIVIDALDECSDPRTVEKILDTLFNHAAKLPIRFFLTSRPEPAIANILLAQDAHSRSILHLHNVEEQLVKADIETYLTVTLANLSLTKGQIQQLAEQAGVLFIYAATLARYILGTTGGIQASRRLITALTGNRSGKNKKDREIDLLYRAIMDGVLEEEQLEEDEIDIIKRVLWTVVCAGEPVTVGTLARLLEEDGAQISAALKPLRSVLQVFEGSELVSTLHASFPQYVLSLERSGASLYCNETRHNEYLARRCFELMEGQLKFNICGLETSYRFDKDVPNLQDRIKELISPELCYACRYWGEHLNRSSAYEEYLPCLNKFLYEQLLFWMEVLNLTGWIASGAQILARTQNWLAKTDEKSDTITFLQDAQNFVATFAARPVHQSTPHIYISALPLEPKQSKVWETYSGRTRGLLPVDGPEQVMWKSGSGVISVAFSPDCTSIASGSYDGTIQVWDAHSGAPLGGPYENHTGGVTCVAFSPDGTRIASGSMDCTIEVRDMHSGTSLACPFHGHTDGVTCIAFSPDSTRISSGSWDHTIQVWDINLQNGTSLCRPMRGHTSGVISVAFSPDGTRIVSGSDDRTIRVWDVHSGTPLGNPFQGHTGGVTCVAFSPDNTRIVSGSHDCTIRVWDVRNGVPLGSQFEGHTYPVSSVAFSPDGARVISGSWDHTIQMWDVQSGTPLGDSFQGHTHIVNSLAFSSDGTRIVSGSWDQTIRVWDVHSGTPLGSRFEGYKESTSSIASLLNSPHVVPDSYDYTTDCAAGECETLHMPDLQLEFQTIPFYGMTSNNSDWLVRPDSQTLLFCLPKLLHNIFPWPPNSLTISPLGIINMAGLTDLSLGASWVQCYEPHNDICS